MNFKKIILNLGIVLLAGGFVALLILKFLSSMTPVFNTGGGLFNPVQLLCLLLVLVTMLAGLLLTIAGLLLAIFKKNEPSENTQEINTPFYLRTALIVILAFILLLTFTRLLASKQRQKEERLMKETYSRMQKEQTNKNFSEQALETR